MAKHDNHPNPNPPSKSLRILTVQVEDGHKANLYGPNNYFLTTNDTGWARFETIDPSIDTFHLKIEPWDTSFKIREVDVPISDVPTYFLAKLEKNYYIPTGYVSTIDKSAQDGRGLHLFLGTTLMPYRWMYANNLNRLNKNLDYLAKKSIDYIRYFVEIGPAVYDPNDGWNDRKADPNFFDASEIDYLFDTYGIRSGLCIFGGCYFSDTPDKRKAIVQKVIDIVKPIQEKITTIEIVNEFFDQLNDAHEVVTLCNMVKSQLPNILCFPSSPAGWQDTYDELYKDNNYRIASCHHERTNKEMGWGYVRGPYSLRELGNMPGPFINDEPEGPKSSIAEDDNPLRQAFMAATSWISREPFVTIHTGAGVYMGGQGGVSHNREANIYEVNNIDAIFDYCNNVRSLLPQDVTSWPEYNGNTAEHLLPAEHVWADGFSDGVLRTYMAISGNRFVMLPYGILNFSDHIPKIAMHIIAYDIANKNVVLESMMNANSKVHLNGSPDANAGYLVIGNF